MGACASVSVLVYSYLYQCMITYFPISVHNLIVNILRSSNDEGLHLSRFHFPWNKEERVVLNSVFREYNLY